MCPTRATVCLVFFGVLASARGEDRRAAQEALDQHALAATGDDEQSIASLAAYLKKAARSDRDKARLVFRWMTDRIAYNSEDFLAGRPVGDVSAPTVLRTRKTFCSGYARLFFALSKSMDLEAVNVVGHAKGYGYLPGEKTKTNHEWNAVKIDDRWYLLDVTWGAGYTDATKGFVKRLDNSLFLPPPEQFVFDHFPVEARWQLITPPIAEETYRNWPKLGRDLFAAGVSAREVRQELATKDFPGFVKTFTHLGQGVRLIDAPLRSQLKAGQEYQFRLVVPCEKLALINGKQWHYATQKDGVYEITLSPEKGPLQVSAKFSDKDTKFWGLLLYQVD